MTATTLGFVSCIALLALLLLRAPIGLAMLLSGMGGMAAYFGDLSLFFAKLQNEVYGTFSNNSLAIIPLFLLMGQFVTVAGISSRLFSAIVALLGHVRGGVAMAAVLACGGFAAVCGSSVATAATMSKVALPEMQRYGYTPGFAAATLAAGGTLGILIPPSLILVIYAILSESNLISLFVAALVPGLLAVFGYIICIYLYVRLHPQEVRCSPAIFWRQRCRQLLQVWPIVVIFSVMLGGHLSRLFHPYRGRSGGCLCDRYIGNYKRQTKLA